MDAPGHEQIYPLYLAAMIDYGNQDGALYANDMAVANAAIAEARAYWRRTHSEPAKYVRGLL